jgi:hypothetical protein
MEKMRPTQRHAAIGVVFDSLKKPPPSHVGGEKRPGNVAGLIFIAKSEKSIVLAAYFLIDANVEIVALSDRTGLDTKLNPKSIDIGQRKQIRECHGKRIEHVRGNDVQRLSGTVVLKGLPHTSHWAPARRALKISPT